MKVMIVGSGGREHTLAWKLKQSALVKELYIAPGNGGTALEGVNVAIKDSDIAGLTDFALEKKIDLVVAGPELPLVLGLTDTLKSKGIPCFGPSGEAARLEGSKVYAKQAMTEAGVPTAAYEEFTDFAKAKAYVEGREAPMVVKADGLAAGKGVIVAQSREEAIEALEDIMVKNAFGEAGDKVIIEDALKGEEASFLAFCDGENVLLLPSSQDHKPIGEGDTGPNTGGMGAYSPAPILPDSEFDRVSNLVIKPLVNRMAERGAPFVGILYAGLMIDGDDINVLEYNVRFGDPECQPLLSRLDCDLAEVMISCVEGRAGSVPLTLKPETAVCVVMAAGGYPGAYGKGMPITGIEDAETLAGVKVFHAGTTLQDGQVVTSGGRVLGVTALGPDLAQAQAQAYRAVDKIHFDTCYVRRDIGAKGLKK